MKSKHSKMDNLSYSELKMQSYFSNEKVSPQVAKNIFKFRGRMANVTANFRSQYEQNVKCPECMKDETLPVVPEDTQEHLLFHVDPEENYRNLYDGDDIKKAKLVNKLIYRVLSTRDNSSHRAK